MEQRSPEWYSYRKNKIGASEVSAILGTSPWMSAYELWLLKTGRAKDKPTSYAMQAGIDAELTIKSLFEQSYPHMKDLTSPTLEYKLWPTLIASLDGFNEKERIVVEFKKPSALIHKGALAGKIPDYYIAQIQTQMLVSESKLGFFCTYDGGHSLGVCQVSADNVFQAKILEACQKFWLCVEGDIPPPKPEGWPEPLFETDILKDLFAKYSAKTEQLELLEDEIEAIKDQIKKRIPQKGNHFGYGYNVSWVERKGSVKYDNIPLLKGLDLEPYRAKSSSYLTLKKRIE